MQHYPHVASELFRVTVAIDEFDGACDPAFDNDLEELERQFAELRLALANEVLEQVGDIHDAEYGISWTTLETVADDLFPKPTSRRRKP